MSRRSLSISLLALLVILTLGGGLWFWSKREDPSTDIQSKRTTKSVHRIKAIFTPLSRQTDPETSNNDPSGQKESQPTDKLDQFLLLAMKDLPAALDFLHHWLLDLTLEDVPSLIKIAKWLDSQGHQEEAADIWRQILDLDALVNSSETNPAETYRSIADSLLQQEGPETAVNFLREAVKKNPDRALIADLGLALIEANQWDEAKSLFEKQLESNPKDPEALFGMGALYATQGDLNKAEKYYQYNLSVNPDHIDTKYNLADLYTFDKKDNQLDAERYYQEILAQVPENMDAQNGLAAVYLQTGRTKEAIEQWKRLTEEHPQESVLFSNLGEAYFHAGNYQEASSVANHALANDPDNAEAYYYKALAERELGNNENYRRFYQEAINRDPELAKTH